MDRDTLQEPLSGNNISHQIKHFTFKNTTNKVTIKATNESLQCESLMTICLQSKITDNLYVLQEVEDTKY